MSFEIEPSLFVLAVLIVLGCNLVCLLLLMAVKPAMRRARQKDGGRSLIHGVRVFSAEAVGTFLFVFMGVLSAMVGRLTGGEATPLLHVALAHGLILAVLVAALGPISGGQFNPAVTLGLLVAGRLHPVAGVACWVAQLAGAIGACFALGGLFGTEAVLAGVPAPGATIPLHVAVLMEAMGTFLLVMVVFGTAVVHSHPWAPAAIGLTVAGCILTLGPLCGSALNPARYLGPALAAGQLQNCALYMTAPLLGGGLAAGVMQFFLTDSPAPTPTVHLKPEDEEIEEVPIRRAA